MLDPEKTLRALTGGSVSGFLLTLARKRSRQVMEQRSERAQLLEQTTEVIGGLVNVLEREGRLTADDIARLRSALRTVTDYQREIP